MGWRSYKAAARAITSADQTKSHIVVSVAQQIRQEMSGICSSQNPSLLRSSYAGVKNFSWKAISSEFSARVPTLMFLLKSILPKSDDGFILFAVALILKKRCKHFVSGAKSHFNIIIWLCYKQTSKFVFDTIMFQWCNT